MFESRIANVIAYGGTAAVLVLAALAVVAEPPPKSIQPKVVESRLTASTPAPVEVPTEAITKPPAVAVPAPRPPEATPDRPLPVRPRAVEPTVPEQPIVRGEAPRSLGTIAVPWPGTIDGSNSGVSGGTRVPDRGRFVPPADIGR